MNPALQTLLEHAERLRDEALAALLQAEAAARRLQVQAEQLCTYRDEVRQRHPAQGGRSASIELLRCHQGFTQRLDQALALQQAQREEADKRTALLRAELLARELRVAAVRKLLERREDEQERIGARQEQRRSDDAPRRSEGGLGAGPWMGAAEALPLAS